MPTHKDNTDSVFEQLAEISEQIQKSRDNDKEYLSELHKTYEEEEIIKGSGHSKRKHFLQWRLNRIDECVSDMMSKK